MKAAVLREFNHDIEFVDRPIPQPKAGEVLVKVMASGLCVSDLHIQDGKIGTVKVPYTPGHEMAGIVDKVGDGVTNVKVGDHICAAIDIVCGTCRFCRAGRTNLCEKLVRIGFERDGSHQEYCVIPANNAVVVPDWIPFEQVTGFPDACACMYNALKNRGQVKEGDCVLILGTGGLGMNAIQIAKNLGAIVYVTSRRQDKIDISLELGADEGINTKTHDLHQEIVNLTNGKMCDVVIDNIGIHSSVNDALKLVRPGGKVIISGYNDFDFTAEYQEIMKFEKEIIGMRASCKTDLLAVIKMAEQRKLIPYVYKTLPLTSINEGFRMMREGEAKGRVVLLTDAYYGKS